jgi:hypothetical protein
MTRQARIQEGVVASYIHDISTRTIPSDTPRRNGAHGHGRPVRLAQARAARRAHKAALRPRSVVTAASEEVVAT